MDIDELLEQLATREKIREICEKSFMKPMKPNAKCIEKSTKNSNTILNCTKCNLPNEFAEPNQLDGSYVCFECR